MAGPLHSIRLKGPWELLGPGMSGESWERRQLPCSWRECFGESAGDARFRRNFHRPTGLEPENRILLRLPEGAGDVVFLQVNGVPIAAESDDPLLFDCTAQLNGFNRIDLSLRFDPSTDPEQPGGLWETVRLEIR